jgi:hypothetical protein
MEKKPRNAGGGKEKLRAESHEPQAPSCKPGAGEPILKILLYAYGAKPVSISNH